MAGTVSPRGLVSFLVLLAVECLFERAAGAPTPVEPGLLHVRFRNSSSAAASSFSEEKNFTFEGLTPIYSKLGFPSSASQVDAEFEVVSPQVMSFLCESLAFKQAAFDKALTSETSLQAAGLLNQSIAAQSSKVMMFPFRFPIRWACCEELDICIDQKDHMAPVLRYLQTVVFLCAQFPGSTLVFVEDSETFVGFYQNLHFGSSAGLTTRYGFAVTNEKQLSECQLLQVHEEMQGDRKAVRELFSTFSSYSRVDGTWNATFATKQNQWELYFDTPFTRFLFQGCMGMLYLTIGLVAAKNYRQIARKNRKGNGNLVTFVLLVNAISMVGLSLLLFLDGYTTVSRWSDQIMLFYRPFLFGTAVGLNVIVAFIWHNIISVQEKLEQGVIANKISGFQRSVKPKLAFFLFFALDITFHICMGLHIGGWPVIKLVPLVFAAVLLLVMVYFFTSARRVQQSIRKAIVQINGGDGDTPKVSFERERSFLLRTAFWTNVTVCASALLLLSLSMMSSYLYLTFPIAHLLVNGVMLTARAVLVLAQIKICQPRSKTHHASDSESEWQKFIHFLKKPHSISPLSLISHTPSSKTNSSNASR